MKDNLSLLQTE